MQSETFKVQNVKCGGCVKAIENGIGTLAGVSGVTVDVTEGRVTVDGNQLTRGILAAKLAELGYPPVG